MNTVAFAPTALKTELIGRLEQRTATIGIVGLGYVGLPLSLRFAEVGYRVIGMDIDRAKVEKLNAGRSYIKHIASDAVAKARARRFEATSEYSKAVECDALIICVPTPLT